MVVAYPGHSRVPVTMIYNMMQSDVVEEEWGRAKERRYSTDGTAESNDVDKRVTRACISRRFLKRILLNYGERFLIFRVARN